MQSPLVIYGKITRYMGRLTEIHAVYAIARQFIPGNIEKTIRTSYILDGHRHQAIS